MLLLILPGPAVMYIVTRSATQGRRAGLVSVAGIHVGTMVHVIAAMVGLSALLAASAQALTLVKLAGAAYLFWLGAQSLLAYRRGSDDLPTGQAVEPVEQRSGARVFWDGVVLNVLNPKTAIFFLSFVPQFVSRDATNPALSLAVLGAVFIVLGVVSDGMFALAGGWIGAKLRNSPWLQRRRDLLAGGTYFGLGAVTMLGGDRAAGSTT